MKPYIRCDVLFACKDSTTCLSSRPGVSLRHTLKGDTIVCYIVIKQNNESTTMFCCLDQATHKEATIYFNVVKATWRSYTILLCDKGNKKELQFIDMCLRQHTEKLVYCYVTYVLDGIKGKPKFAGA